MDDETMLCSLIILCLFWFGSALLSFIDGAKKNRPFEGFILGILLGPIGLIIINNLNVVQEHMDNNDFSLQECPACRKDVSSKAASCPHCGHPINEQSNLIKEAKTTNKRLRWISIGIGLFLLGIMLKACTTNS